MMILRPSPGAPVIVVSALICSITTEIVLIGDRYVSGYDASHPELCPGRGSQLQLMMFVASAPSHFEQRLSIRMTWGQVPVNASLAFIIGATPRKTIRSIINEENVIFRDIIIGRFIDTYENLTLKSLSMLEWLIKYCPLVPRMLKCDDDVFINVPKLMKFVKKTLRNRIKRTIWGDLRSNDAPVRDDESKYYVTADQYPDLVFPDYVTGPAYMMTTDVKRRFFAAAVKERYMKLEDVLITGVLAKQVNVERVNAWKFYNKRYDGDWCEMKKFISVHGITSTELLQIWKQIKTHEC